MMKKIFGIFIIGFIGGIAGSYIYQQALNHTVDQTSAPSLISETNEGVSEKRKPSLITYNEESPEQTSIKDNFSTPVPISDDFINASRQSTKSVVYIKTISQTSYRGTWLDYFFGERSGQAISSGSGVIYRPNGYIITNNHVVQEADNIQVIIEKRTYEATLIGNDPSTDLAVLKIEAKGLPALKIGSSVDVEVGEWVLAVGNPFNLTSTVTAGIVSAKGRELNILKSNFPIESFIQTDAAINPGNSGGALVNMKGELIGINTAILSKTGSYAGYGFAVPSDIVTKVVDDIINYGEVQKAFIGAEVLDIDSKIAEKLDIDNFDGVVVSYVQEDGAAAKVDIRKGDIILKLDNTKIDARSTFEEILSYHSPGDKLNVVYKRNQKIISKTLQLTNKEGTTSIIVRDVFTSRSLGADFEKVSKVERDLMNIENGVRIVKVRPGLIQQMELSEGFIILSINRIPMKDPESLADILTKIRGRVTVEIVNKRGRREYYRYYF
jgi:Do/DeqQ family serine protease